MAKSLKLNIKPDFEFILIGIATSEPIYRISWLINELINIQLKETQSIKVYNNQRQIVQEFSKFSFFSEDEIYFHFLQNKSEQGLLIEEQKQVDYWVKTNDLSIMPDEIISKFNTLKNVNLAFEVKPGSLKSKTRLLFSNENEVD